MDFELIFGLVGWGLFAVAMVYNLTSAKAVAKKIEDLWNSHFGNNAPPSNP